MAKAKTGLSGEAHPLVKEWRRLTAQANASGRQDDLMAALLFHREHGDEIRRALTTKNPKAKKKPATPAPRSSVAMAHSMRGGAGAGKHHTRTRDVETGRSRRPKHGGKRSLAERENPGGRMLDTRGIPMEVTEAEANEIINLILRSLRKMPSASLHWCITREKVFPTKVETLLFLSSDAGNRYRSWQGLKSCLAHAWVSALPAVESAASKFGIKRSPLHTGNDPASLRVEYAAYRDMAIQRGVASSPEWFNKAVNKWLDETGETTGYAKAATDRPYEKFTKQPEPEAFVRAAWWLAHVAPGVRLNPMTGERYAASRQKQAARRQLEAGLAVLREAELEEARIEHARSRAKRARAPKPVLTSAYLAEKGMKRRRNTFTFLSRNPSGYISFYSIEDTGDPFYRERVKATREAIDFIMEKGLASEMRTEREWAPSPTTTVLAIDFEVPRMEGSAEVINSLLTATIDGRPLTHRMSSGRPTRR